MSAGDPRFFALKDALRTAIAMPLSFVLALEVFDSPQMALFAAFGPMALLIFVEFGGRRMARLRAYALLAVGGGLLIVAGTLCSRSPWLAAAAMALVGFTVIFAGVLDGYVAAAQSAAILAFVLAVMVPAGASDIPPRLAGWGLAAAISTAAVLLLWPRRTQSALRASAGEAAAALAGLVGSNAADPKARAAAGAAVEEARRRFISIPHRPSGNGSRTAALARAIDHMGWLRRFAARPAMGKGWSLDAERAEIEAAVPEVLDQIAARLGGAPASAGPHSERLRAAHHALGAATLERFRDLPPGSDEAAAGVELDEAYRLRQLAFGTLQLCEDTAGACGDRRSAAGERLERTQQRIEATGRLARTHASMRSVWFHNSLRGAAGLALAVLVGQLGDLQHGFWVVLGTLSVLRSNALSTGTTVLWALAGTFAGILVGGALIAAVGTNPAVLWPLLPFAVGLAAYAPRAVSFAAGQAAFSLVVLILFNLIDPSGWQVGLTRIEDVAIGAGVSLVTGLLIWPRGATAVLRRALGDAFADAAAYLDATIRSLLGDERELADSATRAFASSQLLDTTLRAFLTERSSARTGVEELGMLSAAATRIGQVSRLLQHAQVLVRLAPVDARLPRVLEARKAFEAERSARCGWFERFGAAISDAAPPPEAELAAAPGIGSVVLERGEGEGELPPGLAIAWAHRHLAVLAAMEPSLTRAAGALGGPTR
ncbi:MAG TPA: FUSC family protein [Thermoanaerobaculia bacterium]|nr:FUSC family protein [Thermoanaerobaculia bacterium]